MPRSKPPPDTPFLHGDRCKTADAEPEWHESRDGRWTRVCSCGSEFRERFTGDIAPNGPAAEPARSAHQHVGECEGSEIGSMVQVEFSEVDRCWRSYCLACTSSYLYWFEPSKTETDLNGDIRPVPRLGNVLYSYELASGQVPA